MDVIHQALPRNGSCGTSVYLQEFESNFRAQRKGKKRETEAPWDLKKGVKKEEPTLPQAMSSRLCARPEEHRAGLQLPDGAGSHAWGRPDFPGLEPPGPPSYHSRVDDCSITSVLALN